MQHLILYFEHGVEDVIPWCAFIEYIRPQLVASGVGEYESDDMAIDGSDCEAVFCGANVHALRAFLLPHLENLAFLRKPTTKVELIFGELEHASERRTVYLNC